MFQPTQQEVELLDQQINESTDVSPQDKNTRREMLRRLFYLGNECRKQGAGEDFLRGRIPHEAVPIMAGSWDVVPTRVCAVMKLWKFKNRDNK